MYHQKLPHPPKDYELHPFLPPTNPTLMQAFWDAADPTFSHIHYDRWLGSPHNITHMWERTWLHRYRRADLVGARVVEYGIGGGLLAQHLFETKNISHYTGFDISNRQVNESETRLRPVYGDAIELKRVDALDARLVTGRVDLFVCQAVIQHFESMNYLVRFLSQAQAIAPRMLMLQTRHATTVREKPKRQKSSPTTEEVQFSLSLPTTALVRLLPAYKLVWNSPVQKGNGYVFHDFRRAK